MLQNALSGERRALTEERRWYEVARGMGGSAEVPTPRPFKTEADVTPNNYPGNFVSPTLLFFPFVLVYFRFFIF
jgi:hypothetical protein